MDRNHDVISFISKLFYLFIYLFIYLYIYFKNLFLNSFLNLSLRRPRVANFADIIKIATMFTKTTFKDSKKLKELENVYQSAICICIYLLM